MANIAFSTPSHHTYNGFLKAYPGLNLEPAIQALSPNIKGTSEISLTPFSKGLSSSQPFLLRMGCKSYVLKVLKKKYTKEERRFEIEAQKYAASLGLAPQVLYEAPDARFFIMTHVKGQALSSTHLKKPEILEKLGKTIHTWHHHTPPFCQKRPRARQLFVRVQKHHQSALRKGVALPSCYKDLYDAYMKQSKKLGEINQVCCHGDLNPNNIFVSESGEIQLIDWPSTTQENLYTDLGYLSLLANMTDCQQQSLLKGYLGRLPTPDEMATLKHFQTRTAFATATVWFDFSESQLDKNTPLVGRIQSLDRLLASPTLLSGRDYLEANIVVSPLSGKSKDIRLYALGFLKTYLEEKSPLPKNI